MMEELDKRLGHLDTLANIAQDLMVEFDVTYNQLYRWSEHDRKLDFPKPVRQQGKYKLYDRREVAEWVYLWLKISKNMGNKGLNGRNH